MRVASFDPSTWRDVPKICCSSRNVYTAISLLRLSKERRIVELSAVNLRWVELRVAELCWLRRRNEIDISSYPAIRL